MSRQIPFTSFQVEDVEIAPWIYVDRDYNIIRITLILHTNEIDIMPVFDNEQLRWLQKRAYEMKEWAEATPQEVDYEGE